MPPFLRTFFLLIALLLAPFALHGVEILEADPNLSARVSGDPQVDASFGNTAYHGLHPGTYMIGTYMIGTIYEPESREASTVFGFRVTESFLREWKDQSEAQLLFSFIEFSNRDIQKICPIFVDRLNSDQPSAITAAGRSPGSVLLRQTILTRITYTVFPCPSIPP